ncbi:SIMPL domain-containing protein [Vitreoscilla massiliensis]|uniref:SIMPL domain-containing protein n=1 Tax=Vitreoscilla massiliensis TaxID=1689272 RepID=A0ABY4E5D9_9NEIS|nr:SIMPL domain-containing protein [Vitreoscilla massiliensis]UOO90677.1 SIMPL domain-containing protein [Vitreoscilla massiliensis]
MAFWKTVAVLGVALGAASLAQAKDIHYNIIQLSDSAQMNVPQNQLNVTLVVESTAANRNDASRDNTVKLNRVMAAIEQAGLKGQLLNRSVNEHNEYVNNKMEKRGWRDYAQFSVFSEDTAKVNQLVAAVQQDARLESQNYGLTTAARRQYEMQLTEQAIHNFQQQAAHITRVLGARNYKIVELNVGDANVNVRPPRMYALAASAKMEMDNSGGVANDMAGETEITVNVSGSIQLQ